MTGIYDEPEAYEMACAYRDIRAEVDALLRWYDRYRPGAPAAALELAAGPAEHARELARRGVTATALDLSPAMCEFARERAAAAGLELTVVEADMRRFELPARFDLAITMLNSVCHLFTLDDLVGHLDAVAAHLTPGGLLVLELAHPADHLTGSPRTSTSWECQVDGTRVRVRWGGQEDLIDPVSQVTMEHVRVSMSDDGATRLVEDLVASRFWTQTEVVAAARLAGGLSLAGCHGDFDDDTGLDSPGAWRMILVFQREPDEPGEGDSRG